jgi:phage shock protein A
VGFSAVSRSFELGSISDSHASSTVVLEEADRFRKENVVNRFKLWTVSLISNVDQMIGKIENHEAVVTSTIEEVQAAAARARVQLQRVHRDGIALDEELQQTVLLPEQWRMRAKSVAPTDQTKALECLRRARIAARRVETLGARLEEHQRIEGQLAKDVGMIDEKLQELREKRNLMRTRQSRAEALRGVQEETQEVSGVAEVFDRWDVRILEMEMTAGCDRPTDSLEEGFLSQEEEADLKRELEGLK